MYHMQNFLITNLVIYKFLNKSIVRLFWLFRTVVSFMFTMVLICIFYKLFNRFDLGGNGLLIFPQLMKGDPKAWVVVGLFYA